MCKNELEMYPTENYVEYFTNETNKEYLNELY